MCALVACASFFLGVALWSPIATAASSSIEGSFTVAATNVAWSNSDSENCEGDFASSTDEPGCRGIKVAFSAFTCGCGVM